MKLLLLFLFVIYFYEINTAALDIKSKINNVLTKVEDLKSSLSTDKFLVRWYFIFKCLIWQTRIEI